MAINMKVGGKFKTESGCEAEVLGHYPGNKYPWVGVVKFGNSNKNISVCSWDDAGSSFEGPYDLAVPKTLYIAKIMVAIAAENADDVTIILERLGEVDGVIFAQNHWNHMRGEYETPRILPGVNPDDVDEDWSLSDAWNRATEDNEIDI